MMLKHISFVALAALAACTTVPSAAPPPPSPPPPPQPAPAPPPPPVVAEPEKAWDVAALTAGDWRYEKEATGSVAFFGGSAGPRIVTLRCVQVARQLVLSIGASGTARTVPVAIRTTSGTLSWTAAGATPDNPIIAITRPASDPGFDWIAYSRGRISVEAQGLPRLILPVWAEISRVIEDCRG